MHDMETDYLVVGAGASGMAFVDALLAAGDAEVVLVDRRHSPGGHWLDAYPFVRLHQPSAYYGVASRMLGLDRIDERGPNAGFYERATADEICAYYAAVLEQDLVPTGRVRFLAMSDYLGEDADGHHVTSLLSGASTTIRVRRKIVDATYVESEIPSRHTPRFGVEEGVKLITPNDLVHEDEAPNGFTVIGAGKTAMDTCTWLLNSGLDPDRIEWIRPRESWMFDRAATQPLERVGSYMQLQATWVEAASAAIDGADFARRIGEAGVFVRIDKEAEPAVFRGSTISVAELESLRSIERVVRGTYVLGIGPQRVHLDDGEIPTTSEQCFIDCTAVGVRPTVPRPLFEPGRITLQYVTIGIIPFSAATVGTVEALRNDDDEKNRLCPPVVFTGNAVDLLGLSYAGITGLTERGREPDLGDWLEQCRLNPARGALSHMDDPEVATAFASLGKHMEPALANLAQRVAADGSF